MSDRKDLLSHWRNRIGALFLAVFSVCCRGELSSADPDSPSGGLGPRDGEILPGVKSCDEGSIDPEEPELARLVFPEYEATLRALFPSLNLEEVALPLDVSFAGYIEQAAGHKPSSSLVSDLDANARKISAQVLLAIPQVTGCAESDQECLAAYLQALAVKAFRAEQNSTTALSVPEFFRAQIPVFGTSEALGMALEVLLQSPEFVYKIERGVPSEGVRRRALTSRELAAKLSYLLWDAPPDAALLADADAGVLLTEAGLETAIERMLTSEQAHAAISSYFRQWLRGDKFFAQLKDKAPEAFPEFSPQVAESIRAGLERYLDEAFFEGTFSGFFDASYAYVDAPSAFIYGITSESSVLERVELDPSKRKGFLSQAGFLAGTSHKSLEAPIQRGVFLLERVLCSPPPPPPPGVILELPPFDPNEPRTLRQVIEDAHAVGTCKGCHKLIDGVGFTLNNYDAIGRFQVEQYGLPVDATGELVAGTDVDGAVGNAVELSTLLASSEQVKTCLTKEFLAHALSRGLTEADACSLPNAVERIDERESRLRSMVPAVANSLAFRSRAAF